MTARNAGAKVLRRRAHPNARDAIMKSTYSFRGSRRPRFVAAAVLAFCATIPLGAQSPTCAPILSPMLKMYDAPFHMYMVDSAGTDAKLHGGKPTVSESIFIGGVTYILSRGQWVKSPIDVVAMRNEAKKHMDEHKATCAHIRDDVVNGEAASVWKVRSDSEDGSSDTEAWISKSRNILLRSDMRIDVGGALGKSHMVATYVYSNVQAPAGVK
jgi:hypothetical protein